MTSNKFSKYLPKGVSGEEHGNLVLFKMAHDEIVEVCRSLYYDDKLQLKQIVAVDERDDAKCFKILYVFGVPKENIFIVPYIEVKDGKPYPSLTPVIHEASMYERKIIALFGLIPEGHPDPRPAILHAHWPEGSYPLRKDFDWNKRPAFTKGTYEMHMVEGEGIYEVSVGPIHAGIIEPGYFRFSVAGEDILMLEPKLGYKHRGVEKMFEHLPMADKLKLAESVSGDTTVSHKIAFCQALENLAQVIVPERALALRTIFSEMERLANHFNDIGFIMLDTGFSFGGSNGARLREQIMQLNQKLTGSRYMKGAVTLGGVTPDISDDAAEALVSELLMIEKDFKEVITVAENSYGLYNRLKATGVLEEQTARDHGVVGVAARASGIVTDARVDYPYAVYGDVKFNMALEDGCDVHARFNVRVKEVYSSISILLQVLGNIPSGDICSKNIGPMAKNSYAVSVSEGWRGDVCYFVSTDSKGQISRVAPRDPSFLNWTAVPYAVKGNVIPDFPLINKSFNLSYSGNDL